MIKNVLLVLITIALITACKNEPKIEYAVISGTVKNIPDGEIILSKIDGFQKKIKVSNEKILDTLRIEEGIYTMLFPKGESMLYITKGAKIQLTANGDNYLETLSFTGDNAEVNNYFKNYFTTYIQFLKNGEKNLAKDEKEYLQDIEKQKKADETTLKALTSFPEKYREREQKRLHYAYLYKKMSYNNNHGYYSKQKDFVASPEFRKELTDFPLNDEEEFFYSLDYKELISSRLKTKFTELTTKDSIPYELAGIKTVTSLISNEKIKNKLLFDNIKGGLSYSKNKEEYLNAFLANSTNTKNNKEIEELYKDLSKLEKGKPSPIFTNYEDYTGGKKSLSDFKGKYVYIDVWATWCIPCRGEVPFLNKLEKQYHNKNIAFVSISVDYKKDANVWRNMIEEQKMKGIQLFADDNFNSKFIKEYKISGIPRFIFLDPNGNIIEANAPRPSSKELIELFNQQNI